MSEYINFFVLDKDLMGGHWVNKPGEKEKNRVAAIGEGPDSQDIKRIILNKDTTPNGNIWFDSIGVLEFIRNLDPEARPKSFDTLDEAIAFYAADNIEVEAVDNFEGILSQALLKLSTMSDD